MKHTKIKSSLFNLINLALAGPAIADSSAGFADFADLKECASLVENTNSNNPQNTPQENRMKAIAHFQPLPSSDPKSLQDVTLPIPTLKPHDLLVRVKAVAVNPVDSKNRLRTSATEVGGVLTPVVLGYDSAGVVEAVGPEVRDFKKGDEVYYAGDILRAGANSELHAVDSRITAKKPRSLDFGAAAALPLTALTAYEGLFEQLAIDPRGAHRGRSILIIGGAGGVGSLAIQMAKQAGLVVIATASRPESQAWVREMGADFVIGRDVPLVEAVGDVAPGGVDYIFNTANTLSYWQQMVDVARPRGRIVSIVESPEKVDVTALMKKSLSFSYELMFTRTLFNTADLERQGQILTHVAEWVDQGVIKSTANQVFGAINAENLRKAHQQIESKTSVGKIVLQGW